jgi:hypothetical protein
MEANHMGLLPPLILITIIKQPTEHNCLPSLYNTHIKSRYFRVLYIDITFFQWVVQYI